MRGDEQKSVQRRDTKIGMGRIRCCIEGMWRIEILENKNMQSRQQRQGNLESVRQTVYETRKMAMVHATLYETCATKQSYNNERP